MRVLLAVDGSAAADVAVDLVQATPWPDGSAIHVLEAVGTAAMIFGGPMPAAAYVDVELEAKLRDTARATLDGLRDRLERPGVTVSTAVVSGRAATAIIDAAHSLEVDLVVVGSRGYGLIERMLLGSVSAEVVDHAPCPVLVARHPSVERLVVATDGSESASRAIDTVSAWHLFTGLPAEALMVNTVRPAAADWAVAMAAGWIEDHPEEIEEVAEDQRRLAEQAADRLRGAGIHAEARLRAGDAAQQIVEAARMDGDLVVMGSRGLGTFSRLLLGSVARKVLLHTHASVLIVREPHATEEVRAPVGAFAAFAL